VPELPLRNQAILQVSFVVMVVAILGGIALIVSGIFMLVPPVTDVSGVLVIAGGGLMIIISILQYALVQVTVKGEANINRIHNNTLDLMDGFRRLETTMKDVARNSALSDAARSITNREKELDALRHVLREEMYRGNWDAATYLIDEIENRFGYKREAESLRKEVAQIREMTIEEKIGEAISHIEKLMDSNHWERARIESERLMKLFPRHQRVMAMPKELGARREARKQELLKQWNEAVEREEVDRGIEILTELDEFLTREEAQSLQDSARHVFKARLVSLGVSFSLAVSEGRWRDALEVGLLIRQEFPNSRMAQEVGQKLDVLQVRAGFKTDADIIEQHEPQKPIEE
jgi:hypothetical protein